MRVIETVNDLSHKELKTAYLTLVQNMPCEHCPAKKVCNPPQFDKTCFMILTKHLMKGKEKCV